MQKKTFFQKTNKQNQFFVPFLIQKKLTVIYLNLLDKFFLRGQDVCFFICKRTPQQGRSLVGLVLLIH